MTGTSKVAAALIRAWREGRPESFEGLELMTESDAYLVQQAVAAELGWFREDVSSAWKLGGSPGGLISAARVPDSSIHSSGWQVPERYCSRFGIEGELVVRLGQDIDEHANAATVYEAIEAWHVGIELCDTRFLNGERANPLLRLADQQLNRALILGEAIKPAPDWSGQAVQVWVNGQIQIADIASHPFTDPLSSLPWLARHAVAENRPLKAGDLVATGSWTGLFWAPSGSTIKVEFVGQGEVLLSS